MTRIIALGFVLLLAPRGVEAQLVPCREPADGRRVAEAIARLRASVDPCGESAEIGAVLDRLERCAGASYEICIGPKATRNVFERSRIPGDRFRTITWNPDLRSALEPGCDGGPVRRDPVASLLHEIAHAAQDCGGLNPGEHELDAVRIENIYRRAAGLCQRTRYGDEPLPSAMIRRCRPGRCTCAVPSGRERRPAERVRPAPGIQAADAAKGPGGNAVVPAR